MLRRVAFSKAITAGVAGALVWDFAVRPFLWAGAPIFDLVHFLGTMISGYTSPWIWWPVGLLMHALVGALWAIFSSHCFWSIYQWKPVLQGLAFALIPTLLAGLIMIPEMGRMHPHVLQGTLTVPGTCAWRLGWGGPAGVVLGHLFYGATLGL